MTDLPPPASPAPGPVESEMETERRSDAMKDQLRKDVASWSAARSESAANHTEDFGVPITKPSPSRPSRAKPKTPPQAEAATPAAPRPPFKMSYDGTTDRDYIAHIIRLGAR